MKTMKTIVTSVVACVWLVGCGINDGVFFGEAECPATDAGTDADTDADADSDADTDADSDADAGTELVQTVECLNSCAKLDIEVCVVAMTLSCLTQMADCRAECSDSEIGDVFEDFVTCEEAAMEQLDQIKCVQRYCVEALATPWADREAAWYVAYLCNGGERILGD